jgi:uncharacterized protein involved in exopolysaccharide biosynthesis
MFNSRQIDPSPPATDLQPAAFDNDAPVFQGVFEPPESPVWSAIRRNKGLVAVFAIVCAIAGVAVGLTKPVTYEASTTLEVGRVSPNSPSFYGFTQSASSLATAFSRSIAAAPVLAQVQKQTGVASSAASGRLSAEPIPLSPAFRVIATGASANGAMELANSASNAVIAYEGRRNSTNPESAAILQKYEAAALASKRAEASLQKLEGEPASPKHLLVAEAGKAAATVKLDALSNAYVAAVASQVQGHGLISLVAGATTATGDQKAKAELYGFVGLLAGIAAGCAAAVFRQRRRLARATS